MPAKFEVLFTPAEFAGLPSSDLTDTTCVVFDIFRATSTIVTALAHGAASVIPVAEINEAVALRKEHPDYLMAGERDGRRITAAQSGGTDFDLGNSPLEFTSEKVHGRQIVISTTNGSRALRACAKAARLFAGSFLNLSATAEAVKSTLPNKVLLVCSGTGEKAAYEDILAAGAMADLLCNGIPADEIGDSARVARRIYRQHAANLMAATEESRNGRRLLSIPELKSDVPYCLEKDVFQIVATMRDGRIVCAKVYS
jgi:2-phosphosulfolactate phosphatase